MKRLTLKPIGARVLVKPVKSEEKTASGIVLPDTVDKEETNQGEIVALGDEKKAGKDSIKIGDRVIYGYGKEIKISGEEMVIVDFSEIYAKINK